MSKPNEQDFNLVLDGLSYWATILNRVAARLALGRIKQALKEAEPAAPETPSAEDLVTIDRPGHERDTAPRKLVLGIPTESS